MAITRIKSNQITDAAVTTAKIADANVTAAKLANNLTYGSDLTVSGNLTVSGTTTSVSTTNTRVEDAIIALSAEASGSASVDAGILINRGSDDNYAVLWDESADQFVLANVGSEDGDTAGNVTISSYANLQVNNLTAAAPTFSGAVNINDTTASSSVSTGSLIVDGGAGVAGALFVGGTFDVAASQTIDFNANKLTNVGDPTSNQEAATKAYVDTNISSASTLTIAADSGSNDTVTVGTNTLTFEGTANEIATTVSDNKINIALPDNVTIGGALTITGNLTVNGTTTTVSTTNSRVSDTIIELNTGAGSNANDMGFIMERGSTGDNAAFLWDESADAFVVGTTTATGDATGNVSFTAAAMNTGALGVTGSVTATGSFIIGSASMNEADLEQLDGLTAGTVTASKAVVADSNKDISSFRNVGMSGNLDIADNGAIRIGTGNDFTITHDGTDTTVANATGSLVINGAGGVVFNENSANVDFRIEGNGTANLFVVDGSQDNVGIGGTPDANCILDLGSATSALILAKGTTAQRPTGVTGQFRYNTTTNQLEYYDNSGWESVSTSFTLATSQVFNGNGSTTEFSLSALTGADSYTVAGVFVTLNGVVQQPTVVYGISGTTLTFTTAPASGDLIEVRKFTTTQTVIGISDTDGDTQVQVEESSDEDIIRFDTAGTERMSISDAGVIAITATTANSTATNGALTVAGGVGIAADASIGDDLRLISDGAILSMGADSEIKITHVADTGILVTDDGGTPTIQLHDANESVSSDGTNLIVTSGGTAFKVPAADGSSGQALITDGSGTLSFGAAGAVITNDESTDAERLIYVGSVTNAALTAATQDSGFTYNPSSGSVTAATFIGALTGNASGSAATLATPRAIALTGAVTGTANFDGSAGISISTTATSDPTITLGGDLTGNCTLTNLGNATLTATIAANSVALSTDTTGNYVAAGATSGSGISGSVSSEGGTFTVTSNATNANTGNTIVFRDGSGDFSANVITATTTAARYADLAEKYAADGDIDAGTVVHFAGEGKVAQCDTANCSSVAGIISTDPAYLMNSEADGVALAISGRVPTKVTGAVAAGDLMVSAGNGMAMANNDAKIGTVIGKAIEAHEGGEGVIEVLALMM